MLLGTLGQVQIQVRLLCGLNDNGETVFAVDDPERTTIRELFREHENFREDKVYRFFIGEKVLKSQGTLASCLPEVLPDIITINAVVQNLPVMKTGQEILDEGLFSQVPEHWNVLPLEGGLLGEKHIPIYDSDGNVLFYHRADSVIESIPAVGQPVIARCFLYDLFFALASVMPQVDFNWRPNCPTEVAFQLMRRISVRVDRNGERVNAPHLLMVLPSLFQMRYFQRFFKFYFGDNDVEFENLVNYESPDSLTTRPFVLNEPIRIEKNVPEFLLIGLDVTGGDTKLKVDVFERADDFERSKAAPNSEVLAESVDERIAIGLIKSQGERPFGMRSIRNTFMKGSCLMGEAKNATWNFGSSANSSSSSLRP